MEIRKVSMKQELTEIVPGFPYLTYEQMNILFNYQRLWTQLATWMRSFIFSTFEESENLPAVTTRLFEKLLLDFYNAFRIFYGVDLSQQFLNALTKFLSNAWQLVNAYKNDDTSLINSSTIQWYQSADELARFLAQVNFYWNEGQWRNLFYQYIRLKIQEIIAIRGGNYEQEIEIYDRIEDLTTIMGSYMARGIIARNIFAPQNGIQE